MKFNGKIAVLKGGFSDERAISLKTSENVEQALKELGFKYTSCLLYTSPSPRD